MQTRFVALTLLLATAALADDALTQTKERPYCGHDNTGQVWPAPADRDACAEIQICTRRGFIYRWKPATVHITQLAKDPKQRTPCETTASNKKGRTVSPVRPILTTEPLP